MKPADTPIPPRPQSRAAQNIVVPRDKIAAFCRNHHIRKLSFFGSVLRDDFRPNSDVDMLVEFEPDARVSLFDMVTMELELSEILGRKVDFKTPEELSRYFRQEILKAAEKVYEQG